MYAPVDGLTEAQVDAYFNQADSNGTGRLVGGEALVFFLRTGVPVEELSKIWLRVRPPDVVENDREQGLTRHQFSLFLRLVAYVQSGYDLSNEVVAVQALDPVVWVEAGMTPLPAPVFRTAGRGQGEDRKVSSPRDGHRHGHGEKKKSEHQHAPRVRRSNTYTDAKHPPLPYEVRYPPLKEKESAKLAGLVGIDGFLMAYPSFENGLLIWGRAEGNLADVQLATEEEAGDGINAGARSLLRFAHHGARTLPVACPREDNDAAQSVEVKHLTHKDKKISCCYMERARGILWVADKEGYVSAYSTKHINAKAVAKDHLLHRWRASRVGYVTCMTATMNHELWTGNNRGIIRVWPHTAGEATFSSVFNPFAEDCEHKGRELRKGTFDRAHNSKILALVNSANEQTIWSVSKQSMLIWDVGSGMCFGAVGEGSSKDSGGREAAAVEAAAVSSGSANSPTDSMGTGLISKHVGLDLDPLNGSILWRPAREDYDYCHSQQESWAALSERGVVELTERITEGAERAVSFFGRLTGVGTKKIASSQYRASMTPTDTLLSHESSSSMLGDHRTGLGVEDASVQPLSPGKAGKHQIVTALGTYDDTIWIGRSDGVISVFESAGKLVENVSLGLPERTHNTDIRCMSLIGREVWVGTMGGDIHRISVEDRTMQGTFRAHFSPVRSIVQTGVRAYSLAADGSISGYNIDQDSATNQLCWDRYLTLGADCYSRRSIGVLAVTWNVGESRPHTGSPFFRWITEHSADKSMIVIALQEVEMGGASVALAAAKETLAAKSQEKGNANAQFWSNSIATTLGRSWYNVSLRQLSGMLVLVFARSNLGKSLGEVKTTSVACGILGVGGNKGAVAVHLSLYRHRMVFVCSHFAAHQHAVDMRNANYHTILQGLDFRNDDGEDDFGDLQFVPTYPDAHVVVGVSENSGNGSDSTANASPAAELVPELPLDLRNVDAVFWMGDLNYRIDGQYDQVCKLAKEREYPLLLLCDQLRREHLGNRVFRGFVEPPIAFQPTYKFDKGSLSTYDSSEKKRVPAWCDRILFYTRRSSKSDDMEIEPVEYSAWMDVIDSDHKPVYGSFKVSLTKLDAPKKRNITASILSDAVQDVESVGIPRFVLSPHTVKLHPFHNPEGVINLHNKGDRPFFFSIQESGETRNATGRQRKNAPDFEIRPARGIVHAGKSSEIFVKAVGGGSSDIMISGGLDMTKFIVSVFSEYAVGGGDGTMHSGVNGGNGTVKSGEFNVVSL